HTSTSVAVPIAVDVRGASTITGFPVATLNGWRTKGGGPPFAKINKSVRYRVVDLEKWMADRVVSSTAEVA
ncbi:helix-turn-helix transcriptional regulator, partial [Paraliomyxa miuraensis]